MLRRKIKNPCIPAMLIVSAILIFAIGTGYALSYIITTVDPVENTFIPAFVDCEVEEVMSEGVKSDVSIKNIGNVDAYIRATVVITWQSETGSNSILARPPQLNRDYTIEWGDDGWIKGADGFWYYREPVAPEQNTTLLIEQLTPIADAPEGYRLSVEILASAIQAEPSDVVAQQWNVTVNNEAISPKE